MRNRLGALAVVCALHGAAHAEPEHTRYVVFTLPTLGGQSSGNSIDDLGLVAGTSNAAGDQTTQAALWLFGFPIGLGTLGGPSSGVIWPVKNTIGVVSGIAETAELQPLGESWSCSAFLPASGHVCRGFVWERGAMRALPTFGGDNGFATGTNDRRQTVGWAENRVHDPTCVAPQVLQFRAALWGPGRDQMRELPPLAGDTTSAATGINDRGQVIGISGICGVAVGQRSAAHAVIWEQGVPRRLEDLGGKAWNTPMALSERGDIVGFANLPDLVPETRFRAHAVLWRRGGAIQDLGTLGTDTSSQGLGVNDRGQVVGLSCGGGSCRAFIHERGAMKDLNDLVVGDHDPLFAAGDINDLGVITGQTAAGAAFVAIPIHVEDDAR